jgi:HEAT repeat protein
MGRTARTIASRSLEAIGANDAAFRPYLIWAKGQIEKQEKSAKTAIEVLGMLHQAAAVPLLKPLLGDRKFPYRSEVIFAIGAIGDQSSYDLLARQLDEDLRGRIVDGAKRREAFSIISALGRSTRTLDVATRSAVLARIVRILPDDDTELSVRVALNFLVGNLEGMDRDLLRWGARIATVALWSADRPELARAGKNAMLGFRQPLVDLCARLVPHAGEEIRQAAMDMAKQYQPGAYLSLGELWYKVSDPDALPVLKRLIFNTVLHDESSVAATRSVYTRSTVRDAATEEQVDITRDRVLASLIHAVEKCGTPEADQHLAELFEQARAGRLQGVGQETVEILMRAQQRAGKTFDRRPDDSADQDADAPIKPLTPEDVEKLNDLKARYWLAGNKRAKKVAAFVHLGQNRVVAAIQPAVQHLTDPDPIISSAALTCLVDMVSGPGVPNALKQQHADALRTALSGRDNPLRVKAAEVLKRIGVNREPWATMVTELAQNNPSLPLRAVLENVLSTSSALSVTLGKSRLTESAVAKAASATRNALGSDPSADPLAQLPGNRTEQKPEDGKGLPGALNKSAGLSALDKKREYLMARQAWIKGGKKGPEPQPPE